VLKILQHDKIWGTIPPLQILGDMSPHPSRDLRPWAYRSKITELQDRHRWYE